MDDTNYYENMIAELREERDALRRTLNDHLESEAAESMRADKLREERDALAALLREIREQGYRKEMTARIDAALAGDKP